MNRDDMSHMEPVFVSHYRARPALPYDEFIVAGGRHPVSKAAGVGANYFAKYEFPNGKKVTVVCGSMFYSRIDAPYEVWVIGADGVHETPDPLPYQTDEDLMLILARAIGDQ